MASSLAILWFGLFLGVTHAFEADHLLAVANLLSTHKNTKRIAFIGAFWGIGHTFTLLIIGTVVLFLKISIPERLALGLELIVAGMLVFLGIRTAFYRKVLHEHTHTHDRHEHTHLHTDHTHQHATKQSFVIGAVHGLAGSGALMVLVISTISSLIEGFTYILLFGLGSIVGMTVMSLILGLPIAYTINKFANLEKLFQTVAGLVSVGFGLWMGYELIFVNRLLGV